MVDLLNAKATRSFSQEISRIWICGEGILGACAFAEKALYLKNMNKYAVRFSSSPIL